MGKRQKGQQNPMGEMTRDCTIHLHKRVQKIQFKNKAPRAIKEIRKFAKQVMLTEDVRVDQQLNKYVWSNGIRNLPRRVRVRLTRRKNEDEEGKGKYFTTVQHLEVESFKGLRTEEVKNKD